MKQLQSLSSLTFPLHPHAQALLVTAVLAAVPLSLVHSAVFIVPAGVGQVLAHRPLKEAFTALAAVNAIVLTWSVRQERKKGKAKVRNSQARNTENGLCGGRLLTRGSVSTDGTEAFLRQHGPLAVGRELLQAQRRLHIVRAAHRMEP